MVYYNSFFGILVISSSDKILKINRFKDVKAMSLMVSFLEHNVFGVMDIKSVDHDPAGLLDLKSTYYINNSHTLRAACPNNNEIAAVTRTLIQS